MNRHRSHAIMLMSLAALLFGCGISTKSHAGRHQCGRCRIQYGQLIHLFLNHKVKEK